MLGIKKVFPSALEVLRQKKRIYDSSPSKKTTAELIEAARAAFAEAKSFTAVNKVLDLTISVNLDMVKFMSESGRRRALELARVEIDSLENIDELLPYLSSSDARVVNLAKIRRNQLRQRKPPQNG